MASNARIVGVIIIVQMVVGYVANFTLLAPVLAAPGFLANAASHPANVSMSALFVILLGVFSMWIAVAMFPMLRERAFALALWLFALSVAGLALAAVESVNLMSMLSLSEAYARAGASQPEKFEALRAAVAASRNWAHYVHLVFAGAALLVFYAALFRLALVPRLLGGLGIASSILQMVVVGAPLFGQPVAFLLLAPLGLCQLATALWLIARGFRPPA